MPILRAGCKLALSLIVSCALVLVNAGCQSEPLPEQPPTPSSNEPKEQLSDNGPREIARKIFILLEDKEQVDIGQVEQLVNAMLNHEDFRDELFTGNYPSVNEPRLLYYLINIPVQLSELSAGSEGKNFDRINCLLLKTSYRISRLQPPAFLTRKFGEEKTRLPGDAGWTDWRVAVISWFSPTYYDLGKKKKAGTLPLRYEPINQQLRALKFLVKEQAQSSLKRNLQWPSPEFLKFERKRSAILADEVEKLNRIVEKSLPKSSL